MATFEPWLGNHNPTEQQRNEYIRKLKAALVDLSGVMAEEGGQFTGDGAASKVVSLANTTLTPKFAIIGTLQGTPKIAISFDGFENGDATAATAAHGGVLAISSSRLGDFQKGSFRAYGSSEFNVSSRIYMYWVVGPVL